MKRKMLALLCVLCLVLPLALLGSTLRGAEEGDQVYSVTKDTAVTE